MRPIAARMRMHQGNNQYQKSPTRDSRVGHQGESAEIVAKKIGNPGLDVAERREEWAGAEQLPGQSKEVHIAFNNDIITIGLTHIKKFPIWERPSADFMAMDH